MESRLVHLSASPDAGAFEPGAFEPAGFGDVVRASLDPALTRPAPHDIPS